MGGQKHRTILLLCLSGFGMTEAAFAQSVDLSDQFNTRFEGTEKPEAVDIGDVKLRGRFEAGLGTNDNVFREDEAEEADTFTEVTAVANAQAGNESKIVSLTAYGSARLHETFNTADRSFAAFVGYGRFDVDNQTRLEIVSIYRLQNQAREDDRVDRNLQFSPTDQMLGGDVYLTRGFGRAALTLRGGIHSSAFDDVTLNNGIPFIREDRNHVRYDARARASFNTSDSLSLFTELGWSERTFEDQVDRNGVLRGSEGRHLALGTFFKSSDDLRGEVAIGVRQQDFADARFDTLTTPTLDAWINWSPLDDFKLTAWTDTDFEEETIFDRAGTLSRSASVQTEYYFTNRWRGATRWRYSHADNVGSTMDDEEWGAKLGLDYELKPGLLTSLEFGRRSYLDGDDLNSFDANEVLLSLKLQN